MSSCHSSTTDACSKCNDVIAIPTMPAHKSICTLAVLQPASLKSVSTQTWHPMPAMPARKGILHNIAMLQPAPFMCVLKLQRINWTTVVVARIPDSQHIATSLELDYMHRLNTKKTKETGVLKIFSAKTSIMQGWCSVSPNTLVVAWKTSWWKNFANKEGLSLTLQPTYSSHKLTFVSV